MNQQEIEAGFWFGGLTVLTVWMLILADHYWGSGLGVIFWVLALLNGMFAGGRLAQLLHPEGDT